MPQLVRRYSLCNEDCEPEEGSHNPEFERCDRCGARIHTAVYEVITDDGEELTVGSECFKDVMGFKYGKWHERAEEVYAAIMTRRPKIEERLGAKVARARSYGSRKLLLISQKGASLAVISIPHNFSDSLIKAGADLRFWSYYRPQFYEVELI